MEYSELKNKLTSISAMGPQKSYENRLIIKEIENFVKAEEIVITYPKNIFTNDNLLIYIFTKSKLLSCSYEKESNIIMIRMKKLQDIEEFRFIKNMDYTELSISFKNEDVLVLKSQVDTNEQWESTFCDYIESISRYLANI